MPDVPPVTHGVHAKRVNPRRVEIYVPAEKLDLVEMVKAHLMVDGSSLSAFCLQAIEEWWAAHKPGNPQQTLDRHVETKPRRPGYFDVSVGSYWWDPKVTAWRLKIDLTRFTPRERLDLSPVPGEPGY